MYSLANSGASFDKNQNRSRIIKFSQKLMNMDFLYKNNMEGKESFSRTVSRLIVFFKITNNNKMFRSFKSKENIHKKLELSEDLTIAPL